MFLPWKIKESAHRILVSIIDRSGAHVAENVDCIRARLIVKCVNDFDKGSLSENDEFDRGVLLAEVLCLKKDKEDGRYQTVWGTKTELGLYRITKRIIEEGK